MFGLGNLPLPLSLGLFGLAAAAVWWAGGRLSVHVSALADRLSLSQGFAGMLLLGGITSLPEIATAGAAAVTGSPDLAVSNLIGTASVNIVLLVVADLLIARAALVALPATSSPLLQGVLGMLLMIGVAAVALLGDQEIFGSELGVGASALLVACIMSLWLSAQYERAPGWTVSDKPEDHDEPADQASRTATGGLLFQIGVSAAVILCAGFVLSQTADGIAQASGIGVGMVGLVLVGFATSLPELSSIRSALKMERFDLAIGDVMGTNLFNVAVLFLIDLGYRDGLALDGLGEFEALAAMQAAAVTGLFLAGVLARRSGTVLRLSAASWSVLLTYVAGLVVLAALAPNT